MGPDEAQEAMDLFGIDLNIDVNAGEPGSASGLVDQFGMGDNSPSSHYQRVTSDRFEDYLDDNKVANQTGPTLPPKRAKYINVDPLLSDDEDEAPGELTTAPKRKENKTDPRIKTLKVLFKKYQTNDFLLVGRMTSEHDDVQGRVHCKDINRCHNKKHIIECTINEMSENFAKAIPIMTFILGQTEEKISKMLLVLEKLETYLLTGVQNNLNHFKKFNI
jgi:hypothetical protein